MHKKLSKLLFVSLLSLPLFATNPSSYDEAFEELSNTPVSQLDLKITQLNLLLNHKTKGIVRKVSLYFEQINQCFGSYHAIHFRQYVKSVDCYRDSFDHKIIVCEVCLNELNLNIRKSISLFRGIYQAIFRHAKSIIHSSFEPANLRVIIKAEEIIKCASSEEYNRLVEEIDEIYISSLPNDPKEKILVIWENGIPYYQDAFFEETNNS